jgi:hypothetical protein
MELHETKRFLAEIGQNSSLRRELVSCVSSYELSELLFNKGFAVSGSDLQTAINIYGNGSSDDNSLNASVNWLSYLLTTFG